MARIPTYERRVAPEVGQAPRALSTAVDTSGLAQGLGNLAGSLAQVAQKEKEEGLKAFALDTDTGASQKANALMYNPENGIFAQKGANAIGVSGRAKAEWDKYGETLLAQARTPDQQSITKQVLANVGTQLQRASTPYEMQEIQAHKNNVETSSLQTAKESAALSANDGEAIGQHLGKLSAVVQERGMRLGWSQEQTDNELLKETSGLHIGVISQLATADPAKAQQYLLANINGMAAPDRLRVASALRPLLDRQTGLQAGQQAFTSATHPDDRVFGAMLQAESNGRQTDDSGQPLTSPKGAIGIAQVMPSTGPEAAEAAGLPWDADRLHTDAAYNQALGKAYFQKQLKSFDGVPVLAVAAYNAGPGKVQEWVQSIGDPRKGEITEEEFAAKIPFAETRGYVQKTLKASQQLPSFGAIAQQIDSRTDLTESQKTIATAEARERFQWQKDEAAQQYQSTLGGAWDHLVSGGKWQEIDAITWSRLTPQDRKSIMGYNQKRESDPEVYTNARELIVSGKDVNLLGMRDKLSNGDFKSLTDLQITRQTGGPTATASMATASTLFNDALRNAGFPTAGKPGSKEAKTVALARRYVDDQIQSLESEQGKKATSDQVQQLIDRAFIQGELPGTGQWWNAWQVNDKARTFELKPGQRTTINHIDQVPPSEKEKITAALERAGLKVTDESILKLLNESRR